MHKALLKKDEKGDELSMAWDFRRRWKMVTEREKFPF